LSLVANLTSECCKISALGNACGEPVSRSQSDYQNTGNSGNNFEENTCSQKGSLDSFSHLSCYSKVKAGAAICIAAPASGS